ncbi:GNAT family N-acetyltransferase [Anditalea andensis]|uniref:N-acetyltransferase domain-containing protein n=1 Tax=Anditalea andensis TaxID=1048983 RepID=A0A074L0S8_9BACT|nr:GNAT family N-acetyltransferase [Anditalea andensis]KEO73463.1 hypothetical protein EL17_11180 [Anditalea andensis]
MVEPKIQKLDWDSSFFGYEVGKLTLSEGDKLSEEKFYEEVLPYDLVYIFSTSEINTQNFNLRDRKVVLEKDNYFTETIEESHDFTIRPFDSNIDDYEKLLDLGLQSGLHSRFNTDNNFCNGEYRKMYTLWTEKLVTDSNSQVCIITKASDMIGFVGYSVVAQQYADIVLVGIDKNYRGQGYGKKLLKKVLSQISSLDVIKVKVTTQMNNQPAIRLYQSQDFKISQIVNIYHFWKR